MFNKRNVIYLLFSIATLSMLTSCEPDDEDLVGNWLTRSSFDGYPRYDAVAFVIGDIAYVGSGYDGDDRYSDFWAYNADDNNWTQVASLGDDSVNYPRQKAVAFGTDTKGYVGTGYDGDVKLKDFWEYDPNTNTWTQKEDFPGTARYGAVAFSINNIGYVGTGYDDNYLKDFYKYDPSTETWTEMSFSGNKRREAVTFVIGDTAYIATGYNNGSYVYDFWKYAPSTGKWEELRNISDKSDDDYDDDYSIVRFGAVAFSVGNYGYIVAGGANSAGKDCWQYDPVYDLWEEKTAIEGTGSSSINAVGFAIGSRGFITTGQSSSTSLDATWGFDPWDDQEDND